MGKKGAYSGESAKDRSINLMDKFISRSHNKNRDLPRLPGRRKDPNIPVDLWPLKDQIEYWETRTDAQRFQEKYTAYSIWYDEIKNMSGVYHRTFVDFTHPLKDFMKMMFEKQMLPTEALRELRKHGVY